MQTVLTTAPRRAAFEDGLGKRYAAYGLGGEPLEVLALRDELTTVSSFEFALRERVSALAPFQHPSFGKIRAVQRVVYETSALAVITDAVSGARLSNVLTVAEAQLLPIEINAALYLIRQLVHAVAALHEKMPGIAHGAIAPERLILTPDARLIVVDQAFSAALEELHFSHDQYWKDLSIPLPPGDVPRLDQRADVMQIGAVALALIVGRRLYSEEYPDKIGALAERTWGVTSTAIVKPLPAALRTWLARTLQLDPRQSYASAMDARAEFELVTGGGDDVTAAASVRSFLAEYGKQAQREGVATDTMPPMLAVPVAIPHEAVSTTSFSPALASVVRAPSPVASVPEAVVPEPSVVVAEPAAVAPAAAVVTPVPAAVAPAAAVVAPVPPAVAPAPSVVVPAPAAVAPARSVAAPVPAAVAPAPSVVVPVPAAVVPAPTVVVPASAGSSVPFVRSQTLNVAPAATPIVSTPRPLATPPRSAVAPPPDRPSFAPSAAPPAAARTPRQFLADQEPEVNTKNSTPWWGRRSIVAASLLVALAAGGVVAGRSYLMPSAAAEASGTLVVDTNPPGAQVAIDGQPRGVTPLTLTLPPGAHQLNLVHDGEPRTIPLTITAGGVVSQFIELPKAGAATGQLEVRSQPPGARVTVDGVSRGTAPLRIDGMMPGPYTVVLANDLGSVTHQVRVEAGTTASLVVPLTAPQGAPVSGWIAVSAPADVQVYEDTLLLGSSRSDRIMVSAGRHELDIVNEALGYRATRTVNVSPGQVAAIRLEWPKGSMSLNAQPWAEVWVDGEHVGETPIGNVAVAIGPHEVVFRHPELGERAVSATVTLTAPARLSVDLRKR